MIRRLKNFLHLFEAMAAGVYYGFPSKRLKVIGVTGTDGKTTTTSLIYHILKNSGKKVSMVSTVYAKVGDREYDTGLHTTTPSAFQIQKLLKKSADAGDDYFVLETTSHALDQNRVFGVKFEMGVITNISHEHLDYHKTFENYGMTKAALLLESKTSIINRDDSSYDILKQILRSKSKGFQTYGLKHDADFKLDLAKKLNIILPEFNAYNYLAAYSVAWLLGLEEKYILEALRSYNPPPGRMEIVYEGDFKVIVDFAHTPNAIYQALKTIKASMEEGGRLIHVFSAAGRRDSSKRPLMGDSSATFADVIILSEEDYRTEDPKMINDQISEGIRKHRFQFMNPQDLKQTARKQYSVIIDRREAIRKAIELAAKDDVIVLTGKGHEQSLARGTHEYPWDDRKTVMDIIKSFNKS